MIVVSDTTPIILLMKAGQLELLQKLFGVVYIPEAVYRELTENEAFCEEVRMVRECEFFYVEEVDNRKSVTILRNFTGLDAGESGWKYIFTQKETGQRLVVENYNLPAEEDKTKKETMNLYEYSYEKKTQKGVREI